MTGAERMRYAMSRWKAIPRDEWLAFVERGLDTFWDPDIVIRGAPEWADSDIAGPVVGQREVLEFWRTWLTSWGTMEADIVECFDAGDRTFVVLDQKMKGQASGLEIGVQYVWAVTWRGDRVWRLQFATSLEEARELLDAEAAP